MPSPLPHPTDAPPSHPTGPLPERPRGPSAARAAALPEPHPLSAPGPGREPGRRRPAPGPTLVSSHPRRRYSPLAMWHLLSLDAPSVAALWTVFIAHVSGVALPWTSSAAMFLAVWIIYAADRLLDARSLDPHSPAARSLDPRSPAARLPDPRSPAVRRGPDIAPPESCPGDLELRHRFHHRHRSQFFIAILLATVALVVLLSGIDPRSLHLYALLAALLGVWMLLIHARPVPSGTTRRLPKELAVGLFFPAAVFIPTVARMPSLRPLLLPAALLFACVCTLNCLYLYAWEHPAPRLHAHWTTRWATRHLTPIAGSILLLSILTTLLAATHPAALNPAAPSTLPAAACGLSAAALLLLDALRCRLSRIHLRASADLVLLMPLPLLLATRLLAR